MAQSPGSADRRARLIREMARQSERSHSRLSDNFSVGSGRAPVDNFADTESQQLPALPGPTPDRSPKYRIDAEYQINTSALRRAFPDFSQYGSSEEDSMEIGRGFDRAAEHRTTLSEEPSEDMTFDFGDGKKYRLTGTPPLKPRPTKANALLSGSVQASSKIARNASQKENLDPLAKTADVMSSSGSSRNGKSERRTLAGLHARVESDDSVSVNGGRPAATGATAKNTRFGGGIRQDLTKAHSEKRLQDPVRDATVTAGNSGVNGTNQSFMLPDLPNITELVSGARQDGTPLINRSVKSRSRFVTPSSLRRTPSGKIIHAPVGEVPVPAEERALYISLQLLQEKVAALEKEKQTCEDRAGEYELEVLQLRSKLQEREEGDNRDSGLGSDKEEEKTKGWESERSKFESSMKSLQARLDRANKKVSASETAIRTLINDRDAANQQLATAYSGSEDLRNESHGVQEEISNLKKQLRRLNKQHEKRIEKLMLQESDLRQKMARREKAINEMAHLAKELWSTRKNQSSRSLSEHDRQGEDTKSRQASSIQRPKSLDNAEAVQSQRRPTSRLHQPSSQLDRHISTSQSEPSHSGKTEASRADHRGEEDMEDELSKRASFLSFMDGDEVEKLRRILEQDKAKHAKASNAPRISNAAAEEISTVRPRKSSLKVTKRNSQNHVQYEDSADKKSTEFSQTVIHDDDPMTTEIDITGPNDISKDVTQQSMASRKSNSRRRSATNVPDEVTSAFILPDITLTGGALAAVQRSQSNVRDSSTKSIKTMIPRPTPVSDRPHDLLPGEEDPTTRPAQPPALALATVLKALEDELAQLRAQLAILEARYHSHDPALSKRQRKSVHARMQKLLAAAEARSDQIYALYDVLEGQKQSGMTMPEEEVEITLQQVGVDPAMLKDAQQTDRKLSSQFVHVHDSDESLMETDDETDEDELPWEGISQTGTQTLDNLGPYRR